MSAETLTALAGAFDVPVEKLSHDEHAYPSITPFLFYQDGATFDWLVKTFGFTVRMKVPGPGGVVVHGELLHGDGLIMVGAASERDKAVTPKMAGVKTMGLYLMVDGADAHCERARAAGAKSSRSRTTRTAIAVTSRRIPRLRVGIRVRARLSRHGFDHFARVQDAMRIERALHRAHDRHLGRAPRVREERLLEEPDAVLGGDAAVVRAARARTDRGRPPSSSRRTRRALIASGFITLMWRLPSPMWPKRQISQPG